MKTDITIDFPKAEKKGLKVFYNDSLGSFDIVTMNETIRFYDEITDHTNAIKDTINFIENF